MSDTVILMTIVIFFVVLGAVLPFVHASFDETATNLNTENIAFESGQSLGQNEVTILGVVLSIITMFFWTFGTIPAIIEVTIFLPIRIIFGVLLFKLIRGVGG